MPVTVDYSQLPTVGTVFTPKMNIAVESSGTIPNMDGWNPIWVNTEFLTTSNQQSIVLALVLSNPNTNTIVTYAKNPSGQAGWYEITFPYGNPAQVKMSSTPYTGDLSQLSYSIMFEYSGLFGVFKNS